MNYYYNIINCSKSEIGYILETLKLSLSNNTSEFLDLQAIQQTINLDLQFLMINKRYAELYYKSNSQLSFNSEGFALFDHTFDSLNEVERALNNKHFF